MHRICQSLSFESKNKMELREQIALEIVLMIIIVWPFVFVVVNGAGDALYDKIDALEDSVGDRIKEYVVLVTSNFEYYFIDLSKVDFSEERIFHNGEVFRDNDGTSCLVEHQEFSEDYGGWWAKVLCPGTTKETDYRLRWEAGIVEKYITSGKRWEELEWLWEEFEWSRPLNPSVETVHNVYVPDFENFEREWRERKGCQCLCHGMGPYCRCICPTTNYVFVPYYNNLAYEMFWETYKIEHKCDCERYRDDNATGPYNYYSSPKNYDQTKGTIFKCKCPNNYEGTSEYGFHLMGGNMDCLCKNWTVVKLPKHFVSSRTNNFLTQLYNCTFSFEANATHEGYPEGEPYDVYSCPKCDTCLSLYPEPRTVYFKGDPIPFTELEEGRCSVLCDVDKMAAGDDVFRWDYTHESFIILSEFCNATCYSIPKNNYGN